VRDGLRQFTKLIETLKTAFAVDARIALGEGPQIAEAPLFVHCLL
jgi:hypothetical protein